MTAVLGGEIDDPATTPLEFSGDFEDNFASGVVELLSYPYDGTVPCEALNIGEGERSWARMTANGDGVTVRFDVFDQDNNLLGTVDPVIWEDLL